MKQKTKKVTTCLVLTLFILSLIGVASAETTIIDDEYDFWTDFMHTLQKIGLFSADGQLRLCSIEPGYTYTTTAGETVSKSSLLSNAGCSANVALLNIFDTDWHYLAEYRTEIIGTGITTPSPRIIEVYCCPYEACESSADCSSPPASDFGDTCDIASGACYGETPTHVTQIMKCENDQWMQYGTASYGDSDWCLEGRSNWIDRDGVTHSCREPTYSSVVDNTWCGAICAEKGASCGYSLTALECCSGLDCQNFQCVKTGECSTGQTKCGSLGENGVNILGYISYKCIDGTWESQGRIEGVCGVIFDKCTDVGGSCESSCASDQEDLGDKSDCSSSQTCCRYITGDGVTGTGEAKTLTWSEYYSIENKDALKSMCVVDSDCSSKTDYEVSCLIDDDTKERIFDANVEECEDVSPGGLIGLVPDLFTQILVGESFCEFDQGMASWFDDVFGNDQAGICIAESTTWYGKIWDSALKLMGSMGLPNQYVMIITIMLLITLIGIAVRMVTR